MRQMRGTTLSWPWLHLGIGLMLALGLGHGAAFAQAERNPGQDLAPRESGEAARVIVKLKPDSALLRKHALLSSASPRETLATVTVRANSLGARLGLSLRAGRALNQHAQVVFASRISSAALAERLSREADVEYAVVDRRRKHFAVPNDPLYAQGPPILNSTGGPIVGQWYLHAPTSALPSSINATGAWDLTTGSSNIVVAVLDSGIRPEHPDLAGRLLAGYNMISDIPTGNDGAGRDVDASDPGDWVTAGEANDPSSPFYQCDASDSSWHGTMTASLIGAASNNGAGMTGVAWGVKLLPVRVLGKCGGYDSDIIAGMQWAAGLPVPGVPANPTPAQVINMSLGSSGACLQSYIEAINAITGKQNPAVIVASAGNSSGQAVSVPANCPGVIAVAGLRHIGTKVGFSDLGPEITLSAPGGNCVNTDSTLPCLYPILAATNTGSSSPVASSYTDAFNSSVGTSFSAPLVAGTAALMLSIQPSLTPAQVTALLQTSARAFPATGAEATVQICHAPSSNVEQLECYCTTSTCGAGMLDSAAAIAAVTSTSINFLTGWNLAGNSVQAPLSVVGSFGDAARVVSVWKWVTSGTTSGIAYPTWAYYSPAQSDGGQAHARSMGYEFLTSVNAGEGFWLNAKTDFTALLPSGTAVAAASFQNLSSGWHLISIGAARTPGGFNTDLSVSPPAAGVTPQNFKTLWAWDSAQSKWYFYAPSLAAQGGSVLSDFITSRGYLDFTSSGKTLGTGVGFWVNKP